MWWFIYQYIVPSLDDGDEQCHLHLQLFVVYHSLLSEVHVKLNFDHSNSMNTETPNLSLNPHYSQSWGIILPKCFWRGYI